MQAPDLMNLCQPLSCLYFGWLQSENKLLGLCYQNQKWPDLWTGILLLIGLISLLLGVTFSHEIFYEKIIGLFLSEGLIIGHDSYFYKFGRNDQGAVVMYKGSG